MIAKITPVILSVLLLMILSSCSSYVGRTVDMSQPSVCRISESQSTCILSDKDIRIEIEIDALAEANNYLAKGAVDLLEKANFNEYTNIDLMIYLIDDGVIVDTVIMRLGGGEIGNKIPINRKFTSEKHFDAFIMSYSYRVQG